MFTRELVALYKIIHFSLKYVNRLVLFGFQTKKPNETEGKFLKKSLKSLCFDRDSVRSSVGINLNFMIACAYLETFPRVFSFLKSGINASGGKCSMVL